jgi:hypothetical protein
VLKRFPEAKHAQVEQLIVYAKLMGLTGRDLVSIGGKMDREERARVIQENIGVINSFECLPIGKDSRYRVNERFKLKMAQGAYNFEYDTFDFWKVTSLRTGARKSYQTNVYDYELPKTDWRVKLRYAILLDIASGKFLLDF